MIIGVIKLISVSGDLTYFRKLDKYLSRFTITGLYVLEDLIKLKGSSIVSEKYS